MDEDRQKFEQTGGGAPTETDKKDYLITTRALFVATLIMALLVGALGIMAYNNAASYKPQVIPTQPVSAYPSVQYKSPSPIPSKTYSVTATATITATSDTTSQI